MQAPNTIASDYDALISYVTKDARNDVQKVRAIYSWLAAQPIYSMKFPNVKDAHNPEGYMKTIQQGDGSYPAFFALLCRYRVWVGWCGFVLDFWVALSVFGSCSVCLPV